MARTSMIKKTAAASTPTESHQKQSTSSAAQVRMSPSTKYPGLGLPLRYDDAFYPIGAHGSNSGSQCVPIFVRELAMLDVMEKLTDKPDWDQKVFDNEIVSKWRKEALAIPDDDLWKLAVFGKSQFWGEDGQVQFRDSAAYSTRPDNILNEEAFDCCIKELQSKAKYLQKTGIVPTLDVEASVAKSDNLVTPQLQNALREAFEKLKADNATTPDWHPNSNEMVQDLVHPSMYPLVYGRSRVFQEECVGVDDAIQKWAGKGEVIPNDDWKADPQRDRFRYGVGSVEVPPEYWSNTYQWLPANVAFSDDGGVKFTSYINNLHPTKYPGIYRTIEELIKTSLPMWDQCLKPIHEKGAGRNEQRVDEPNSFDDDEEDNWTPRKEECADAEVSDKDLEDEGWDPEYCEPEELTEYKWKVVRKALLPGSSFSDLEYAPESDKRLVHRFRDSGLQIIVKLASIELTPDKPTFPVGGWHVEGQMNEHICATALYYLDSDNITSSNLSFRMQTISDINSEDKYMVQQDSYSWMESVWGTNLGSSNDPCLQNYGTVETRPGRLLAFPNVFQHRVSPFELIDKTKPGHRRFIALWLVDPTLRIISTANVPPQQMSWYAESILGETRESREAGLDKLPTEIVNLLQEKEVLAINSSGGASVKENAKLPEELMDMVRTHFNANEEQMPMSVEEAHEHRKELMAERSAFVKNAEEGWQQHSYSFCEH